MNIFNGRINRKQYILGCLLMLPITVILLLSFSLVGVIIRIVFPTVTSYDVSQVAGPLIVFILVFYITFILGIKRFRDVGKSGSSFIFLQIASIILPPINLYVLYKLFSKGDPKQNNFGANPDNKKLLDAIFNYN